MRRWVIGLIAFIVSTLIALWLWRILQPSEVIEVRAKILPIGFFWNFEIRDLNGDGSDELLVKVTSHPWFGRGSDRVFIVTMHNGRLVAHPTPFVFTWISSTGGRRLIGIVESSGSKEVAVAEWMPDGKWKVEKLGITGLYHNYAFAIGDWDGDGEDNTSIVLKDQNTLFFQKQPKGGWQKVKERRIMKSWGISGTEWGVQIHRDDEVPLFFWRGQWCFGQPNEAVSLFSGDWDGNGQPDKLLVRVSPDGKTLTMHLALESKQSKKQHLSHRFRFADWEVIKWIAATNQLGDGHWHLLVPLMKPKPLTLRLMDFWFSPNRNWQMTEFARWQVEVIVLPVEILVGDSDEDGRTEIFVVADEHLCRLLKTSSGWQIQTLSFLSQSEFLRWVEIGKRLWFFRSQHHLLELGNFRTDGRWEVKWKVARSLWHEAVDDLNGDGFPEVLVFQGRFFPHPVIWWRAKSVWRKHALVGSSLLRLINGWLHSPEGFVEPEEIIVVRWEGKKWFVVLWSDGVVQAVTLKQPKGRR